MSLLALPPQPAQPATQQPAADGGGGGGGAAEATHLQWISERHVALADEPAPSGLRPGVRLLCVWLDAQPYACKLLGGAAQGRVVVQFEDGLQFSAEEGALRAMLEEPLFPEALQLDEDVPSRPGGRRMAAKPRGGGAATVRGAWVADASQRGPLQRIMGSFEQTWRGVDAFSAHVKLLGKVKGSPAVQRDVGGVTGLHVCHSLLNGLDPTPTTPTPYPLP